MVTQSDAQREIAKWLNEESTAPINRKALATMACELVKLQHENSVHDAEMDVLRALCQAGWAASCKQDLSKHRTELWDALDKLNAIRKVQP